MIDATSLRFLADESCDFAVVRALRADRFDVYAVNEVMQRSDDRVLIEQAARENRILAFVVLQPGVVRITRKPD